MRLSVGDYIWVEQHYDGASWVYKRRPAIVIRLHKRYRHKLAQLITPYVKFLDGRGVAEVAESYCKPMSALEALAWGTKDDSQD